MAKSNGSASAAPLTPADKEAAEAAARARALEREQVRAKGQVVIPVGQLRLREHANDDWVVVAPRGVWVEDLEDPQLWTGVAQRLKPYDVVRVIANDESFFAECLVRDALPGKAIVKVLRVVELGARITDDSPGMPPNHWVRRGQSNEGWMVERKNPDDTVTVMAKGGDNGFWTRQQATEWLLNHASVREWSRARG